MTLLHCNFVQNDLVSATERNGIISAHLPKFYTVFPNNKKSFGYTAFVVLLRVVWLVQLKMTLLSFIKKLVHQPNFCLLKENHFVHFKEIYIPIV